MSFLCCVTYADKIKKEMVLTSEQIKQHRKNHKHGYAKIEVLSEVL